MMRGGMRGGMGGGMMGMEVDLDDWGVGDG